MSDAPRRFARSRTGATVRQRLQLMSLSLVLPAIVAMALLMHGQYQSSRRQNEAQLLANTRLLGLSAERELDHGSTLLAGLALAPSLQAGDFVAFEEVARASTRGRQGWVTLMDDQQHQVINTRAPPGAPPPGKGGFPPEAWKQLQGGRTRVSPLTFGILVNRPTIAIAQPVLIKGRFYVLSYIQEPATFQSIFAPNLLPPSWIGVIIDQNHRVIARSQAHDAFLGRSATPDLLAALRRSPEGTLPSRSLEGTPTLLSYARSPRTGWTFMIAVPRRELRWAAARSVGVAFTGFAILLVGGLLSARWFARPISRDIGDLAEQARRLAGANPQVELGGQFEETAAVREVLARAAETLAEREAEQAAANDRQRTLINELNHRVKNTLATVQSLARQSFVAAEERHALRAFEDRVVALSQAHNLLTENAWTGADLGRLIAQTLAPYGDRAQANGPAISLDPQAAVSLSLVLHELATNAAKYGAFSDGGRVEVVWRLRPDNRGLELLWSESGGPPVTAPTREGFGSRLIRHSIERELRGYMTLNYAPTGLICRFDLPLSEKIRALYEPEQRAEARGDRGLASAVSISAESKNP
jgi:two-component sensor histidine kinase